MMIARPSQILAQLLTTMRDDDRRPLCVGQTEPSGAWMVWAPEPFDDARGDGLSPAEVDHVTALLAAHGQQLDSTPIPPPPAPVELNYRAYDTVTEWSGPPRATEREAQKDCSAHGYGCSRQGGYGSAIVCRRDPEAPGRLETREHGGSGWVSVWPPHGRSTGAARWIDSAKAVDQ